MGQNKNVCAADGEQIENRILPYYQMEEGKQVIQTAESIMPQMPGEGVYCPIRSDRSQGSA